MLKVLECVPNFSEGCNNSVLEEFASIIKNTPGVSLMDFSADKNHNRSVFSFTGDPEGVANAAVALAKKASELIDLTVHSGEHPRMGAIDVIPFIPIRNMNMDEAVLISRQVGERIWREAGIPVFLYENSATAPHRRNLADIRRGGFEGMPEKTQLPAWKPDFGSGVHLTAGVTAVGARSPLIAFNVNLSTSDIAVAKAIARSIRESNGGLKCVKAIGVMLSDRNTAQVSVNMTDFNTTPLYRMVEMVRMEAHRYGVTVSGTELIGLAPMKAFADSAAYYLQLENYDYQRMILENRLSY